MLDKLTSLFSHDIGIDLGTANTLVWVRGKGIVIREPSIVALHKKTKKVIAVGTEAKKMLGKTPESIITVKPLSGGVISDFDVTTSMLSSYIKAVHDMEASMLPTALSRPKVVIGIPSSVTEVQRRAVWEAALTAGAREAFLIEEPMASAIGEGISIFQPTGKMIVDIGGGTTEIAIISLGGIVVSKSMRLAGDDMDLAIAHYIRLKHGILLGEKTVEDIKIKLGSAYERSYRHRQGLGGQAKSKSLTAGNEKKNDDFSERLEKMAVVRGRDIETGLPKSLRVTEVEIREALSPVVSKITEGIAEVLEETPPELISDILEQGILLTGGGSQLLGLDALIVERTHIPVIRSEDPLTTVVRGTGKVLEDDSLLDRVKVIGGLK
ncbi:MAG: Cell shape determining protein, MreB/Mrl family [Candidatus Levybacteria bacterium GW2011_GWA2_40_8]|nr:MAG: Cell shape determining protein, MreB/Mrl family [Candidatus Levybacteria bacterium GW2011_GWA2_40_8]